MKIFTEYLPNIEYIQEYEKHFYAKIDKVKKISKC